MNRSFITGVTGVVGSAIFKKLLLQSNEPIVVLIRGDASAKLKTVFSFLKLDPIDFEGRITVINASAEDPEFQLSESEFSTMAKSLKSIFHCAANVDLMQSLQSATKQSLDSMQNLFRILELNPQAKLEHVSTVGVNGQLKTGLSETRIDMNRKFFNTYEETKALVETKIYELMDQGYNINIHRPSMVVGDSQTGAIVHFQIFYFLMRLISGEFTLGLIPPIMNRKLDTIPSDFVAEMLLVSSRSAKINQKIIHHCSGPELSLTFSELLSTFNSAKEEINLKARKPTILPMSFFENTARALSFLPLEEKWKVRLGLMPQLLNYAQQDQIFLNSMTRELMPELSWPLPKDYVKHSMSYYLKIRNKLY